MDEDEAHVELDGSIFMVHWGDRLTRYRDIRTLSRRERVLTEASCGLRRLWVVWCKEDQLLRKVTRCSFYSQAAQPKSNSAVHILRMLCRSVVCQPIASPL